MVGRLAHRGGRAAHSRACFGPILASMVLVPLLSGFHDFRDRITSCCHGVSPPTLVFLYTFMHNMWRQNTYPKEIESR